MCTIAADAALAPSLPFANCGHRLTTTALFAVKCSAAYLRVCGCVLLLQCALGNFDIVQIQCSEHCSVNGSVQCSVKCVVSVQRNVCTA